MRQLIFYFSLILIATNSFAFELSKSEQRLLNYCAVIANNRLKADPADQLAYVSLKYVEYYKPDNKRLLNIYAKSKHGFELDELKISMKEKDLARYFYRAVEKRMQAKDFLEDPENIEWAVLTMKLCERLGNRSPELQQKLLSLNDYGFQGALEKNLGLRTIRYSESQELSPLFASRSIKNRELKERFSRTAFKRDESLAKAISWLLKQQNDNGFWGAQVHDFVISGLVLQALMTQGDIQAKPNSKKLFEKAVKAMGRYRSKDLRRQSYGHLAAVEALTELYDFTKDETIAKNLGALLKSLKQSQCSDGGFGHYLSQNSSSTPTSSLMLKQFSLLALAGQDHSGLISGVNKYLNYTVNDNAYVVFSRRKSFDQFYSRVDLDTVSFLGLSLAKIKDKRFQNLAEINFHHLENEEELELYNLYNILQGAYFSGDLSRDDLMDTYWPNLIQKQNDDGSWTLSKKAHWGPFTDSKNQQLYDTALAVLILAMDYRYDYSLLYKKAS